MECGAAAAATRREPRRLQSNKANAKLKIENCKFIRQDSHNELRRIGGTLHVHFSIYTFHFSLSLLIFSQQPLSFDLRAASSTICVR